MVKIAYTVLLGILLAGLIAPGKFLYAQDAVERVDTIETFVLKGMDDKEITLDSLLADNEMMVLIFTSSHCSWSIHYEQRMKDLHKKYEDKKIGFVAINSNDPSMSESDRAARMRVISPFPFPYLKDADQKVAQRLEATRNPEAFVLVPIKKAEASAKQTFKIAYHGKIDDNPLDAAMVKDAYLDQALSQILAGKQPEPAETSPSGCNIKWIR